ncbi:hypothetical protein R3P38DRAFT_2999489 [Favolaschia claudopus]|uniref:Uncharacterized protein n=1 Tax=Favolaschia claudopus TaxID=2862362 RepID=A0AAW0AP42_9AGAR
MGRHRKPRTHRGKGPISTLKKQQRPRKVKVRSVQNFGHLAQMIHLAVRFPDEFARTRRDRKVVSEAATRLHWGAPTSLPDISDDPNISLFIKTDDPTPAQLKRFGPGGLPRWLLRREFKNNLWREALLRQKWPKWLVMRFADVVKPETQQRILSIWDRIKSLIRYPPTELQRSRSPALHLGIWALYSLWPYITADSLQKIPMAHKLTATSLKKARERQKLAIEGLDEILGIVRAEVVPVLEPLMREHAPEGDLVQSAIHRRVRRLLRRQLRGRPNLDFGGLFFTIALKEGCSEFLHVDWNDCIHRYAIIICMGDYENGEFCTPQLGHRIPLPPGAVLVVRTRLLAHCAVSGAGRRLVFTCFTDSSLLARIVTGDYAFL